MIEIGRLCMKIAGRDAGEQCVVVEILDDNYVTIDGCTRRRKCNIMHLEPMDKVLKIKQGASHEVVVKEFEKLGLKALTTKAKTVPPRPRQQRKVKVKVEKEAKPKPAQTKKKEEVKESPKPEVKEAKPAAQPEPKKEDPKTK